jgi:hypothetical protein
MSMRLPFTDGFNSLAHFGLGFMGGQLSPVPYLTAGFLVYQFILAPDVNSPVDTLEYAAGFAFRRWYNDGVPIV